MDFGLFKKIIDEVKDVNRHIWLHHFGEPALDKNLPAYIKYAKDCGIRTGISSNGTKLTKDISKKIIEAGLDEIIISLDGATRETYNKIRINGEFNDVVKNIENLITAREELGKKNPYIILSIIQMNDTEKELDMFADRWKDTKVDNILLKKFVTWCDQKEGVKDLAKKKHMVISEERKRPPCYYLWDSVVVYWDGTVVSCCRDFDGKMIIGNLKNNTLEEIWHSEKAIAIRERHKQGDFNFSICKACKDYPDTAPTKFLINKKNWNKVLQRLSKIYTNRKNKHYM